MDARYIRVGQLLSGHGDHLKREMPETTPEQFDELVTPHLEILHRVAYRLLRNGPDAKDLVQDVCITACEHLTDLKAVEHPDRWLLRVLHNRFLNITKRRKRSPLVLIEDVPEAIQIASTEPGPEVSMQMDDAWRALELAYLHLDETQRTLLSLRTEGYDMNEIHSITGISRDVLRARLYRARRTLGQHLERMQGNPLVEALSPRRVT